MLSGVTYKEVNDFGLHVLTTEGKNRSILADTIILAAESIPSTYLAVTLKDESLELHHIGDCLKPRGILEAIAEGSQIGRSI